jgi:hypothetical protein
VHALFDKGGFILLPEGDVVDKYMNNGKPDFDGDVRDSIAFAQPRGLMHSNQRTNNVCYKYTLIASPQTDGYPLHRLPFPAQHGESQEAVNFSYPFADFPVLQSHVHPCFAICHAGRFKPNLAQYLLSTSPDLYICVTASPLAVVCVMCLRDRLRDSSQLSGRSRTEG